MSKARSVSVETNECIVMVGNIGDGYTAHGPFASFDEAADWAQQYAADYSWVMTLHRPMTELEQASAMLLAPPI